MPGPVCYGRGGKEATVTDADLILGRIDPTTFSGGKMPLEVAAAKRALAAALAAPLKLATEHAALGVSEMVDENMANAARVHAIESGKDLVPRTLIAFGGAAPLHATRVAEKVGIGRVLVPVNAGVGSATLNTAQQVGGSIGTALLNTIFTSAVKTFPRAAIWMPFFIIATC